MLYLSLTLVPYYPSELASFQRAVLHYWDSARTCFTLTSLHRGCVSDEEEEEQKKRPRC